MLLLSSFYIIYLIYYFLISIFGSFEIDFNILSSISLNHRRYSLIFNMFNNYFIFGLIYWILILILIFRLKSLILEFWFKNNFDLEIVLSSFNGFFYGCVLQIFYIPINSIIQSMEFIQHQFINLFSLIFSIFFIYYFSFTDPTNISRLTLTSLFKEISLFFFTLIFGMKSLNILFNSEDISTDETNLK